WTRTGWSVRGERRIDLAGGVRHVHVRVDLQGPAALLVRLTLVVVLDIALLAACWLGSLVVAEGWRPRLPSVLAALRTSYRVRLTAALSGFFVVPVLLFAVWSFARLGDEARRAGDLLIRQTLRDAAATAGAPPPPSPPVADRVSSVARATAEPANRLGADLWLYQNGVLAATSAPVLGGLGLIDPRGAPPPAFPPGAPREFEPVISAFERMAADVERSQAALEQARLRTARVLANVATGVIAVDEELRVTMANPRAAELLGAPLEAGDLLTEAAPTAWRPVWNAVADYLRTRSERIAEREFDIGGRQIRGQLATVGEGGGGRGGGPSPGGCVVALDDATAFTRAAGVLAWGEMARQVAHEIKNPLTPIRLGVQHLQRARAEGRARDFDATLEDTAARILAEIDRLDAIARAFSRFASPQ